MKKIIILILVLLFSCGAFACSKGETVNNDDIVTVYNFEKGIHAVRMDADFGIVTLNENKDYVASGERSIKLSPCNKSQTPMIFFPFNSIYLEDNYAKLDYINYVSLKIYSEADTTIQMGYCFVDKSSKTLPEDFALKKGWNDIKLKNDLALISIQYVTTDFYGLYLNYKSNDSIPVIYIDDVSASFSDNEIKYEDLVKFKYDEGYFEICDFEYAYQNYAFYSTTIGYKPEFEIVDVSKEGLDITASSGKNALKIIPVSTDKAWTFARVVLSDIIFNKIDFAYFEADLDSYVLKYDYYQIANKVTNFNVNFFYGTDNKYQEFSSSSVNTWTTNSVPLNKLGEFFKDKTKIAFVYENIDDAERVIYLDNIRIEKI